MLLAAGGRVQLQVAAAALVELFLGRQLLRRAILIPSQLVQVALEKQLHTAARLQERMVLILQSLG